MTDVDADVVATALEPVRDALLRQARSDAEAELLAADTAARTRLEAARAEARRITDDARSQGEADAAMMLGRDRAQARRRAHASVLAAQQGAYEGLRRRAREAVRALRVDPGYDALVAQLSDSVRRTLGDDAVIRMHPDGGLIADAPGRHVELSLDALADRAVDALGADVSGLWSA